VAAASGTAPTASGPSSASAATRSSSLATVADARPQFGVPETPAGSAIGCNLPIIITGQGICVEVDDFSYDKLELVMLA
jgi:hypothetical protein